jgi:hypothetical protein
VHLKKDGSLAKHQPAHDDPNGLSPHTATIATMQLYAGETHSHIWQSKEGDYPCTPTGEEWPHDDGRIYARVTGLQWARHTGIPKDELFPADRRGRCFVFRGEALELLLASHWLRSQHLVAHNAVFEAEFILQHTRDYKPPPFRRRNGRLECSMQATGLLNGTGKGGGGRSLAAAAQAFLGLEVAKDVRPSDWGASHLSRGQLAYAAADAVLTHRIWPRLSDGTKTKSRTKAYDLQRGAVAAVADWSCAVYCSIETPMQSWPTNGCVNWPRRGRITCGRPASRPRHHQMMSAAG